MEAVHKDSGHPTVIVSESRLVRVEGVEDRHGNQEVGNAADGEPGSG